MTSDASSQAPKDASIVDPADVPEAQVAEKDVPPLPTLLVDDESQAEAARRAIGIDPGLFTGVRSLEIYVLSLSLTAVQ